MDGVVSGFSELPRERFYIDNREIINFNEFTIFEIMHYDAIYTVLAGAVNGTVRIRMKPSDEDNIYLQSIIVTKRK